MKNLTDKTVIINDIKPQVAVPMHYGAIAGSESDAKRFAELAGERVVIL